jgi:hypothetical protein
MMKEYSRQTTEEIVNVNFDTDKRGKIVEKVRQFFPGLAGLDDSVGSFMRIATRDHPLTISVGVIDSGFHEHVEARAPGRPVSCRG